MAKHWVLNTRSKTEPGAVTAPSYHGRTQWAKLLPGSTPDAENRTSGGVGGSRRAITVTRPDPRTGKRFAPGRALASMMHTKFRTTEISLRAARFVSFVSIFRTGCYD